MHLHNWLDARERISFQGHRTNLLGWSRGPASPPVAFNEMVRNGELSAPVVIGRDHLDSGSVASPNRETESMKDGSDALSDWPFVKCAVGAIAVQHGCRSIMVVVSVWDFPAVQGMVICCDGTEDADRRIANVLWNDPATG